MHLEGTPSDQLPGVLATGTTAVRYGFFSFSGREPAGRDAEYIAWHSLDHRPEQYRLAGLRASLRLVSTPACRAARAANEAPFDAVDHIMTYLFTNAAELSGFFELGDALDQGGRMPLRLPSIGYMTGDLSGKTAAATAAAGADVIPWRPALGVYVIVEEGQLSPEALTNIAGVAGVWWFDGAVTPPPYDNDSCGKRIIYCYLEGDPIETATLLGEAVRSRWASTKVKGLLAAPFYSIVPFEWDRHLPA
ncbi:hypothetical protein [Sphingomonas solaris]|uniref:Uncharacterized protein n=1 Tax=Alterirhizorhabdus solaris TaxID=2529389 RepID=A0A558R9A2_9SPHN|nr:hypothetical protein [Sphingomonas solaris]TVV75957.1 hypothetical protein FOY91_05800 [Sphingomonas solaris]